MNDTQSTSDLRDPVALFQAANTAIRAEDWAKAASLCDDVSLRAFQRQLAAQFLPANLPGLLTVEQYMHAVPDTPRDVAEYMVAEQRRHSDPAARFAIEFPDLQSVEDIRTLHPEALFTYWLEGRSMRRQITWATDTGRAPAHALATLDQTIGQWNRFRALGAVRDGDDIAHVNFRNDFNTDETTSRDMADWLATMPEDEQVLARTLSRRGHCFTVACRLQEDGSWRLLAGHDFMRMGGGQMIGWSSLDESGESGTSSEDSRADGR